MVELENASGFSAMTVRIDNTVETKPAPGLRFDLAQIIDTACQSAKGIWGQLEPDILGCYFPEHDETSAQTLALSIQSILAEQRTETVSIGIAVYPTLDFQKHQIIDNARKALDHAQFFGPGSLVLFDAVSLNISGDTYYQTGDIDRAVQEFMTALRLDPDNVNVHNSLGVCFGVLGDYDQARAELRRTTVPLNIVLSPY